LAADQVFEGSNCSNSRSLGLLAKHLRVSHYPTSSAGNGVGDSAYWQVRERPLRLDILTGVGPTLYPTLCPIGCLGNLAQVHRFGLASRRRRCIRLDWLEVSDKDHASECLNSRAQSETPPTGRSEAPRSEPLGREAGASIRLAQGCPWLSG
jgi:hypothetical protein